MGEGVPITNTLFPPPPVYYKAFTAQNVARFAALRGEGATTGAEGEGSSTSTTAAASTSTSAAAGIDEAALAAPPAPGELDRLASELSPPRADWVREDGRWMLFGQMYTVRLSCARRHRDQRTPLHLFLSRDHADMYAPRLNHTSQQHAKSAFLPWSPTQCHKAATRSARRCRCSCIVSCTRCWRSWTF